MKNRRNRKKTSHSRYAYRNPFLYRVNRKHRISKAETPAEIQLQALEKKGFIARQKEYHSNEIQLRNARIEQAVSRQEQSRQEVRNIRQENRDLKRQLKESRKSFHQAQKDYKSARKNARIAKKKNYGVWTSLLALVVSVTGIFLAFTVKWLFDTWPKLQMDELVYQLSVSFQGTGGGMVQKFISSALLPTVLCLIMVIILLCLLAHAGKHVRDIGKSVLTALGAVAIAISGTMFCTRMDVMAYLNNQMNGSEFIEKNYVDPSEVELVFPEEKRNLIMIFLESMETTYASISDGGAFENGVIPELTRLSQENENFSGDRKTLNGGVSMPGTTWTMGGLFAATSGLPLQIDISGNNMDTQTAFFPSITTLGDILNEAGYTSVFECGSDGVFGGRQLYFSTHGNYEIHDINYYKSIGLLDEDYYVWWGYEDQKLISYAKEELTQLAGQDQPFNYTMLTADTHFENGYPCSICVDEYGDQYANVMACSSRQISELVSWIQEQDWYENTTIVITGDHPTMDSDFCNGVDDDYQRRVYTAYINAAPAENNSKGMRSFTTFDTFPTVLSALGVRIDGNRLGLGTDLFSGVSTLLERSDVLSFSTELSKSSDFMKEKASLEQDTDALINRSGISPGGNVTLVSYDESSEKAVYSVDDIFYLSGSIQAMRISTYDGEELLDEGVLEYDGCGQYTGSIRIPVEHMNTVTVRIDVDVQKDDAIKTVNIFDCTGNVYLTAMQGNSFYEYLRGIEEIDLSHYTIFMTVQSEAADRITDRERDLMQEIGIGNLISTKKPAAYAIISEDGVRTGNGMDYVRENGTLSNGVPYVISSSANQEQTSSIIVGYEFDDYSLHNRGINIVVYDQINDVIAGQKSFNTADYAPDCNIAVEKSSLISSRYTIRVTDITGANTVSRVLARVYDVADPDYVKEQYLNLNFDHEYEAQIDLAGHRKEDIVIYVYAEDTDFRYHFAGSTEIKKTGSVSALTSLFRSGI
ncbi:MAG: sulfatase-like hydrolase/transferase [Bulleidia sp.]|nr:sulfatase-like hydrolase/transferase [Bulleidia sp.]